MPNTHANRTITVLLHVEVDTTIWPTVCHQEHQLYDVISSHFFCEEAFKDLSIGQQLEVEEVVSELRAGRVHYIDGHGDYDGDHYVLLSIPQPLPTMQERELATGCQELLNWAVEGLPVDGVVRRRAAAGGGVAAAVEEIKSQAMQYVVRSVPAQEPQADGAAPAAVV